MKTLVVSKSGEGNFDEVGKALSAACENDRIYIKNGIYREKLLIDKPGLTIEGESAEETVISYGDYALMKDGEGKPIGTFKTASVRVGEESEGIVIKNLTIENDAGEGKIVGQAVALYIDCDRAYLENVKLKGRQDTLLSGPLPEDISGEAMPVRRQYFKNCYIEGNVDFIFGGGVSLFENCEIFIAAREGFPGGYVTAACTGEGLDYGYVFKNCRITGSGVKGQCFLGRPWRGFAKTVFIDCASDDILNGEVFSRWNNTDRHKTCFYGFNGLENFKNSRADWVKYLSDEECKRYTVENMFGDWLI